MERQVQASLDWEMDGTEFSPDANEQGNGNQDEGEINDIERNNFSPDSLSEPLWDQEFLDSDMLCYSPHPRPGAVSSFIPWIREPQSVFSPGFRVVQNELFLNEV